MCNHVMCNIMCSKNRMFLRKFIARNLIRTLKQILKQRISFGLTCTYYCRKTIENVEHDYKYRIDQS